MNYERQLIDIILHDDYLMSLLKTIEKSNLNNTWLCAGIIRNTVWDTLSHTSTRVNDIDVIYYDTLNTSWEKEKQLEEKLASVFPNQPWSVKNQARMHLKSGFNPYKSVYDGVAHFPETPTAIAVRIYKGKFEILAPYGLDDLFEMKVRPTIFYKKNTYYHSIYTERVKSKNWVKTWKKLSVDS